MTPQPPEREIPGHREQVLQRDGWPKEQWRSSKSCARISLIFWTARYLKRRWIVISKKQMSFFQLKQADRDHREKIEEFIERKLKVWDELQW